MRVIGRKKEIRILDDCVRSYYPELVVVYGRRRVGKTFLIKEYFENDFSFCSTGLSRGNSKEQLREFNNALQLYGSEDKTMPKDWFTAFRRLRTLLESKDAHRHYESGKKIVFLDEVPWMDTRRSAFKTALELFWNSWGSSQADLVLIICGSATSWIIDNVLHDTGGLYNRATKRIHLEPFTLKECEEFFVSEGFSMTREQIIESYMIFGGVPYYLRLMSPRYSLHQDVDRLIFKKNGPLADEYSHLYASLFRFSDNYVKVIDALYSKNAGLTREEIRDCTGIDTGGGLTKILQGLEECDFIRKYQGFTKSGAGYTYQLIDSFTLFYKKFVDEEKLNSWINYIYSPGYYAWSGIAFERVCLNHSDQIKEALGIAGMVTSEYSWRSRNTEPGAQIDLLIDRRDGIIDIIEMKYAKDKYTITPSCRNDLIHKREVFQKETETEKAIHIIMLAANGVARNGNDDVLINTLTKDDLFGH